MFSNRPYSPVLVGLVLLALASGSSAIGWGRSTSSAEIGQPLDFTATLRLDPGDSVDAGCVAAEVVVGEQRLPPHLVVLAVDSPSADAFRMRVSTLGAVQEPVLTVTLGIGCPPRMSRRFVLLADPPSSGSTAAIAAAAPSVLAESVAGRPAADAPVSRSAASTPTSAPAPATAKAAMPTSVAGSTAAARPSIPRPAPSAASAVRVARPAAPPTPPPAAAAPRLRLDPAERPEPLSSAEARAVDEALEAVARAAESARATAQAASAAEQRLAALETTVAQLRAESNASRELAAKMEQRLAESEGSSRWLTPLLLAVAALAGLALWLVTRLRSLTAERQLAWQRAAVAEGATSNVRPATPISQLPMVTSEIMPLVPAFSSTQDAWPRQTPAQPSLATRSDEPEPSTARTEVLPARTRTDATAPRDVSMEELLDLEQQAEFFVVLGQDEAAIDLLVEHLRSTGGGSPLPYLKLLEIYRRRNERDAYERTRARFNDRFNAYAPEWDADLQQGRSLEDYGDVLPRLQQAWPRPIDAMAELEALLFRKSRGELFELPAYREVFFLYSLARDLLDHGAVEVGQVDVLLPLADDAGRVAASTQPYLAVEGDSVFDRMGDDRPTAPVDLDLTQPESQTVIVDPLLPRRPGP